MSVMIVISMGRMGGGAVGSVGSRDGEDDDDDGDDVLRAMWDHHDDSSSTAARRRQRAPLHGQRAPVMRQITQVAIAVTTHASLDEI